MVALTLWGVGGLLLSVVVVLVVGGGRASCLKGFVARGQGGHLGRPRVGAGVRLARWLLAGEKFPWAWVAQFCQRREHGQVHWLAE